MDTALINGDFKVSSNGRPEQIDGTQELLQRAAIRLNVPLGSFVYDAQLGSRLHSLKAEDDALNAKALAMAQEALKPLPQLTVESVSCAVGEPVVVMVQLSYSGGNAAIEVKI